MKNTLLCICLIILPLVNLLSQDATGSAANKWTNLLHLEAGIMNPDGKIKDNIAVRQNISSYYVDQVSDGNITSDTYGVLMGLRWEFFNRDLNAGISAGLRYTQFRTELTGYSSSRANFFYLRYSMLNTDTKFARVKKITEVNNFISIPLEVRYIPIDFSNFKIFIKAGAEIAGYNLAKETDIAFQEKSMESYQDEILNSMGSTSKNFYSTLYASVGCALGEENKANYIFEIFLPSLFLGSNNFALTEADYFDGFKFSIQFPLKKQF